MNEIPGRSMDDSVPLQNILFGKSISCVKSSSLKYIF